MSPRLFLSSVLLLVVSAFSAAAGPLLGKMGQATARVSIYAAPTTRSRVYYQAKAYEYLIVRTTTTKAGWIRILMSNGIDAYAKKDKVVVLPYDIKAKALVQLFIDNFAQFEDHVDAGVRDAAPKAA